MVNNMTFQERCARFKRNSEKETNIYIYVYRTIFLDKKIQEYEREENMFAMKEKERPKDHRCAKRMIKKEQ